MRATKLHYKLLGDVHLINKNEGKCLIDYVMYALKENDSHKNIKRNYVESYFNPDGSGTYKQVFDLARNLKYIRIDVLNPLGNIIDTYKSDLGTHGKYHTHLCFMINNGHAYPILSKEAKKTIIKSGRLELSNIEFSLKFDNNFVYVGLDDLELVMDSLVMGTYCVDKKVVLIEDNNTLNTLGNKIMGKTNYILYNIQFYKSNLSAFEHPVSKQIYVGVKDYKEREQICKDLYEVIPSDSLKWNNQTFANLGKSFLSLYKGNLPVSVYSPDYLDIIKDYPINPYIGRVYNAVDYECDSYDFCKCFTSILLNMKYDYPVYTALDEVEIYDGGDIKCGEYYIDKIMYLAERTIKLSNGFYPYSFVMEALERKIIEKDDIKYQYLAKQKISKNYFVDFCNKIFEIFKGKDGFKNIINHLIGCLRKSNFSMTQGCFTDDLVCAFATIQDEESKGNECSLDIFNDIYFIKSVKRLWLSEGHIPLHRQIIAETYFKLEDMYFDVKKTFDCEVYGYNVDSIKIIKKNETVFDPYLLVKNEHLVFMNVEKKEKEIGKFYYEGKKFVRGVYIDDLQMNPKYEGKDMKWKVFEETRKNYDMLIKRNFDMNCLNTGEAGCGKTYLICELMKVLKNEKVIGFSFTNNAVYEVNRRSGKNIFQTFDSFFIAEKSISFHAKSLGEYDRIMIDEISMTPTKFLKMLLLAKQVNPNIKINAFGDFSQCPPVEPIIGCDNQINYDIFESRLLKEIFNGNWNKMLYKPELGRYDEKLHHYLKHLLKTGKLGFADWNIGELDFVDDFKRNEVSSYVNICYTNKKRIEINNKCCVRFLKEKKQKGVMIGKKLFCVGMPVVVHSIPEKWNGLCKKMEIMTSNKFNITEIKDDIVVMKNKYDIIKEVKFELFNDVFDYGFCMTTHKYQGASIDEPFNIYEAHLMNLNIVYTAISRSTKFDYVHIVGDIKKRYYKPSLTTECYELNIYSKLRKGIIYKISGEGWSYYGKTLQTLEERYKEHLEKPTNDEMAEKLKGEHKIEELSNIYVKDDKQLCQIEDEYINHFIKAGENLLNVKSTKKAKKQKDKKEVEVKIVWNNQLKFNPVCDVKNNWWVIQYRDDDGKKKMNKVRFGKDKTKEQAFEEINKIAIELRNKYC